MNRRALWPVALGFFLGGLVLGLLLPRSASPLSLESAVAAEPARTENDRPTTPPDNGKLRILCFGAHPDACELRSGGVAALWTAQGHPVQFGSVTNGGLGHRRDAAAPLARV